MCCLFLGYGRLVGASLSGWRGKGAPGPPSPGSPTCSHAPSRVVRLHTQAGIKVVCSCEGGLWELGVRLVVDDPPYSKASVYVPLTPQALWCPPLCLLH